MGLSNYLPNSRISQSGVCTSSTRPASPYEGQIIYETDTNRVLVWDNAAWVMIADTDQPPGLQLVKTQTVGSAVSSVTVTDAFSTDFDDYRIIVNGITPSANTGMVFNFVNSSGTTISTNYGMGGFYQAGSGTLNGDYTTTNGNVEFGYTTANQKFTTSFDVLAPNLAQYSVFPQLMCFGNGVNILRGGIHFITTAYPSFRIAPNSGTMTGGTIRVYGYRIS